MLTTRSAGNGPAAARLANMRPLAGAVAAAAVLLLAAGCDGGDAPAPANPPPSPARSSATDGETAGAEPDVDGVVTTGLVTPWGLTFLPDGSALVSERDTAQIKRIASDGRVTEVGEIADVRPQGEGGLLGIAYRDGQLYAYFTSNGDNRIVRRPYNDGRLGEVQVLLEGSPPRESTKRRPIDVRAGRDALRRDGRRRPASQRPGSGVTGRQDPPHDPGR